MTRQFFATLTMLVVLGCGAPRGQPASGGNASVPTPDPAQPSTGTSADAGPPDAGTTAADPPDAGTGPDCSANAPFDSRCYDPGRTSVAVSQSDAAQCAAFLPVTVPEPVLYTHTFPGPYQGVSSCGAVPDGDGHLGVCMYSDSSPGPADNSVTLVLSADGATLPSLPGQVRRSQPHGFLTEHDGVDYGQSSTLFGWSPRGSGSLLLGRIPYPLQPDPPSCGWATSPDSSVTATCWSPQEGPSLRRFDDALVETGPAVPLAETIGVYGIDEQQRMLAQDTAGTLRWYDLDGRVLSGPIAGKIAGPIRPLVQGGFDTSAGVLASGSTEFAPKPSWLADRADSDLSLVRGRRAYAFVRPLRAPCQQAVELLAPDGTLCATIEFAPTSCAPGTVLSRLTLQIGAEGSVAAQAGGYCQGDSCLVGWRAFPRLLQ